MKKVGVVMGSDSDLSHLEDTFKTLKKFGVPFEGRVLPIETLRNYTNGQKH